MTHRARLLEAHLSRAQTAELYRKLAPVYDRWASLTEVRARRRCLERAAVRDGEAVLEVAVGTGLTLVELARRNPHGRNAGVDLTPAMLERARARLAPLGVPSELVVGDAAALPYADASFDLVLASYLFDLLPEPDFAVVLAEMRRVLRPGGRVVIVNMAPGGGLLGRLAAALYRVRPEWMGGCRGVELAPYVAAAGFARVACEPVSELGVASEVVTARRP